MEALTTEIETRSGRLNITNFYNSPSVDLDIKFIKKITKPKGQHDIIGDFNSPSKQLGSKRDSQNGKKLVKLTNGTNFFAHLPDLPTRGENVLDLAVSLDLHAAITVSTLGKQHSDHNPILATIHVAPDFLQQVPKLNFEKTNWKTFKENLQKFESPQQLITRQNIDTVITLLQETILKAIAESTPTKKWKLPKPTPLPTMIHALKKRKILTLC